MVEFLLFSDGRYDNIQNAVMTTWLVSFDQISERDEVAAEYLKHMSFMSEKDIPRSFLYTNYGYEASQNDDYKIEIEWPNEVDDFQAEKSIGTLIAYAFITKNDNGRLLRFASISFTVDEELAAKEERHNHVRYPGGYATRHNLSSTQA